MTPEGSHEERWKRKKIDPDRRKIGGGKKKIHRANKKICRRIFCFARHIFFYPAHVSRRVSRIGERYDEAMFRREPPRHLAELRVRAEALAGRTVGEIARALGVTIDGEPLRNKGRVGELIERALGASAGSAATPDFPHLGVELKTVPVDERGAPRESTFVCSIRLDEADRASWERSAAQSKLAHVLFVPVEAAVGTALGERRVGRARFFRPTAAQEAVLRADFEDLVGRIGAGGADALTAREGRWLQVRPKAADGSVRTLAPAGDDGLLVETGPRGFYLRRRFVAAILVDPEALPE